MGENKGKNTDFEKNEIPKKMLKEWINGKVKKTPKKEECYKFEISKKILGEYSWRILVEKWG